MLNEYKAKICGACPFRHSPDCPYVKRGLETKCPDFGFIEAGWELCKAELLEWLKEEQEQSGPATLVQHVINKINSLG